MRVTTYLLRATIFIGIVGFQHHCGSGAALRAAEAETRKAVSGTVTDFKVNSLEIAVKGDNGEAVFFPVGPETEVVQVPPGERDLSRAKPARVTDLSRGDRILVSFVSGLTEARRIVWISATDIAARNAAEREDWQKRGISGTVTSKQGGEITLEIRSLLGVGKTTLAITPTTRVRRYAPDSVSFTDALPSTFDAVSAGDQLRSRGSRNAEGKLVAEDIVFGTFLTKMGAVGSVDLAAKTLRIRELTSQKELTVRLNASSQLKMVPGMKDVPRDAPAGASHDGHTAQPPAGGFDLGKIIAQLPVGKLEDLKVGGIVIVTSTAGVKSDEVTAILVMGNVDAMIQMARSQSKGGDGMSATEAMSALHGGALAGPNGVTLPGIIP